MPTLPWKKPANAPAVDEAYVMASRFEVRSLAVVPRFFLRSMAAWKQVNQAPGVLGASLLAQPMKKTFWTLSAWDGRPSLYEYARTNPHGEIMKSLRPVMKRSTFVMYTVPADQLPLQWDDAKKRLLEQIAVEDAA